MAGVKGSVEAQYSSIQTSAPDSTHGAVSIEFGLTSEGSKVTGKDLVAVISRIESSTPVRLFSVPVAKSNEKYLVSWALLDKEAKSGRYTVGIYGESEDTASVSPLFTLNVDYEGSSSQILPFRTETVVVALLGAAFLVFSYTKSKIEAKRK